MFLSSLPFEELKAVNTCRSKPDGGLWGVKEMEECWNCKKKQNKKNCICWGSVSVPLVAVGR